MGRYREKLEILADILHVAENGARKTQIMYNANLSYKLLRKYLEEALEGELLKPDGDGYIITDKGHEFLAGVGDYLKRLETLQDQLENVEKERALLETCFGTNQDFDALAFKKDMLGKGVKSDAFRVSFPSKGVILAAGDGARIRSVTYGAYPKELLPIGNVPTIRFPLEALRLAGVRNFFVVVAPQTKHGIVDGLRSGRRFDVNVCYVVQEHIRGLRGLGVAIQSARSWVGQEDFVVACGDTILCNLAASNPLDCLKPLTNVHLKNNPIASVLVYPTKADPTRFGLVQFKDLSVHDGVWFGEVGDAVEKPSLDVANGFKANGYHYVIAGYYIFKSKIFDYIEKTKPGVAGEIQITDAIRSALKSGEKVFGVVHCRGKGSDLLPCEYWDVGVPEDYKKANRRLVDLDLEKMLHLGESE